MAIRSAFLALASAIVLAAPAGAQTKEEPVEKLVERLASGRYAEREAAARALLARGRAALAPLEEAARSGADVETRRRAGQLAAKIRTRVAGERLLAGTKVRLVFKDRAVREAVPEIAERTEFPIMLDGDLTGLAGRKVTLDTGETTFWQALDQFCRAAGLSERVSGHSGPGGARGPVRLDDAVVDPSGRPGIPMHHLYVPILLTDRKAPAVPTHYAGRIRIRALPADWPGLLPGPSGAGAPQPPGRALYVEIMPEPRSPWRGLLGLSVLRAADESGREVSGFEPYLSPTLDPARAGEDPGALFDASGVARVSPRADQHVFPLRLKQKGPLPRVLKEVEGKATVLLDGQEEVLRVPDVLKAAGKTFKSESGESLKVTEARRNADGSVRVRVELQTSRPLHAAEPEIVRVRPGFVAVRPPASPPVPLSLTDAQGRAWKRSGGLVGVNEPGDGQFVFEFQLVFRPGPGQEGPGTLVYTVSRELPVDVPFRLRDVPLR